jgi:hypothetical protein
MVPHTHAVGSKGIAVGMERDTMKPLRRAWLPWSALPPWVLAWRWGLGSVFEGRGEKLLTESQVQRSFSKLFAKDRDIQAESFDKAEALLDELRPESPLRYQLLQQMDEIRELRGLMD